MQAGEFILVQTWNSLQGGQVHYIDAAAEAPITADSLQLAGFFLVFICLCNFFFGLRASA